MGGRRRSISFGHTNAVYPEPLPGVGTRFHFHFIRGKMRDAMERVLTVNASPDSANSGGEFGIGSIEEKGDYADNFGISPPSATGIPSSNADQGPCLYLGPRGQRCDRRETKA